MTTIQRTRAVSRFSCLGDKCPDTCCRGWSMQLGEETLARYKKDAPELLVAVEPGQGAGDAAWIMRKNPATGYCVKFEDGLCGIHKARGEDFLGDACHFYPRITRRLGEEVTITAALSCPEIARLMLLEEGGFAFEPAEIDRLPHALRDYLPDGMSADDALATHRAFLSATEDETASAEQIVARIASVSRSLELIDRKDWAKAAPLYLKLADGRLPAPDIHIADPFNLLHALVGLIVASKKPMSQRLSQTVGDMEKGLKVKLDWQQVLIETDSASLPAYQALAARWKEAAARFQPILRRYVKAQLSMALFPFAGFGDSLGERAAIIGIRLATVRLALMCAVGNVPDEEVVRVVQSVSRFLDHLASPDFSRQIYSETGWLSEARLRGLLQ